MIRSEMVWFSLLFIGILCTCSALNLPGVPSEFTATDEVLSAISDDIANKFSKEYVTYLKTGVESAELRRISQQLANSHSKRDIFIRNVGELAPADQFFLCTTCRATVNVVSRMFLEPDGVLNGPNKEEDTKKVMLDICDRFKIQTAEVCSGLFDINWPIIDHVMQNSIADSRSLCATLPLNICNAKQNEFNWSVKIDQSGAPITGPKSDKPTTTSTDFNLLHVTDIHYDPEYVVGSLADCDEPMCCRRDKDTAEGTSKAAGYWSDYRVCDSPLHMIVDAFDQMKREHTKIESIYHTGDIVPHNVWSTTKEGNLQALTEIYNLMDEKFPGIPIYSCIGNHEGHPANVFGTETSNVPEELNIKWLYEHLYSLWSKHLPASTQETILKGGYYTVSPKSGLRIISLNNMDCYLFNWWIFSNGNFAIDQLQWLHDTLLEAEKANEKVHILAHIPSGDSDCWTVWSREYNRVIVRFRDTISGIFNGHTHKDEMNVHYSEEGHAVGISWNAGSLTSFTYKNPNYRVYLVEPERHEVADHQTWIFNLTEANLYAGDRNPVWEVDLHFSKDFTDDCSPNGIDKLLEQFADNPDMLRKYWRHKMTSADPQLERGCDNKCLLSTICRLATTDYSNKKRCNELKSRLEIALDNKPTETPTDKPTDTTTDKPTDKPTETPTDTPTDKPTEKPEGDGATSLMALKITSMIGLYFVVKMLI